MWIYRHCSFAGRCFRTDKNSEYVFTVIRWGIIIIFYCRPLYQLKQHNKLNFSTAQFTCVSLTSAFFSAILNAYLQHRRSNFLYTAAHDFFNRKIYIIFATHLRITNLATQCVFVSTLYNVSNTISCRNIASPRGKNTRSETAIAAGARKRPDSVSKNTNVDYETSQLREWTRS